MCPKRPREAWYCAMKAIRRCAVWPLGSPDVIAKHRGDVTLGEAGMGEPHYRLLPALAAGRLGEGYYLYDGQARGAPVLFVPTQKVTERVYRVVSRLRAAVPPGDAWELQRLEELFPEEAERKVVQLLLARGYLEEVEQDKRAEVTGETGLTHSVVAATQEAFAATEAKHFFNVPRLFGLPAQGGDDAHVAFAGVPFASMPISAGAAEAPGYLRRLSQRWVNWFEVYEGGVYTEAGMAGGLPRLLGQGIVLRDFGDVGAAARTVGDLFTAAGQAVDALVARRLPAVFVGGDHAVTVPLVHAYRQHYPDLCVIHLDAHNDVLYGAGAVFHHAATVANVLLFSDVQQVISFGLRTDLGVETKALHRLAAAPTYAQRLHLYSLAATKRLLTDLASLEEVLAEVKDRPCYLTLDLDVLSPEALHGQVSTPAGAGLEWWELLQLVDALVARLRVLACDVVEFNPSKGVSPPEASPKMLALLLFLIDGLARQGHRGGR